jgi:transposase
MENTLVKTRKRYNSDFKRNAVELVKTGHRSCRAVERDLSIPQGMLHRWMKEYSDAPKTSFPGIGKKRIIAENVDPEVLALKQENSELQLERDILKKALAIVSRMPNRNMFSLVK